MTEVQTFTQEFFCFFFLSFFHHSSGFEEQHLADYNELHCLSMTKHIQCRNSLSVFY